LKLEGWPPPWNNPRGTRKLLKKGATMKLNTIQRKKSRWGLEAPFGKEELVDRMY
jgi:hypothetical protein